MPIVRLISEESNKDSRGKFESVDFGSKNHPILGETRIFLKKGPRHLLVFIESKIRNSF